MLREKLSETSQPSKVLESVMSQLMDGTSGLRLMGEGGGEGGGGEGGGEGGGGEGGGGVGGGGEGGGGDGGGGKG